MSKFLTFRTFFSSHLSRRHIKLLVVGGIASLLHLQLILWMINSFQSIETLPNQVSATSAAALKIRFVAINPQTNAFNPQLDQAITEQSAQQEKKVSKIISSNQTSTEKQVTRSTTNSVLNKPNIKHPQVSESTYKVSNLPKPLDRPTTAHQNIQQMSHSEISKTAESDKNISSQQSTQQPKTITKDALEQVKTMTAELKPIQRRLSYPNRARSLGVEGRVRVQFDISRSGTLLNIRILSENPVGVFTESVLKDMSRWRYQTSSDVKNQVVNIVFKLDGRIALDN